MPKVSQNYSIDYAQRQELALAQERKRFKKQNIIVGICITLFCSMLSALYFAWPVLPPTVQATIVWIWEFLGNFVGPTL